MQRIEWITLMFFGAMFITMECLARLGLIEWIGNQTEILILLVNKEYQLALAIVIVLWVSHNGLCRFQIINTYFSLSDISTYIINCR